MGLHKLFVDVNKEIDVLKVIKGDLYYNIEALRTTFGDTPLVDDLSRTRNMIGKVITNIDGAMSKAINEDFDASQKSFVDTISYALNLKE